MLDIMYDIPSEEGVVEVTMTEAAVLQDEPPIIVYEHRHRGASA